MYIHEFLARYIFTREPVEYENEYLLTHLFCQIKEILMQGEACQILRTCCVFDLC